MATGYWTNTILSSDTAAITSGTITMSGWCDSTPTKRKKKKEKPETALAWLDRRVDEMRLAL